MESPEKPSETGIIAYWTLKYVPPFPDVEGSVGLRFLHVSFLSPSSPLHKAEGIPKEFTLVDEHLLSKHGRGPCKPIQYFLNTLKTRSGSQNHSSLLVFVLPYTTGWISNADFLDLRLLALKDEYQIINFAEPLQKCVWNNFDSTTDLSEILAATVGVLVKDTLSPFDLQGLETALLGRLDFPWLSQSPLSRRRLALICGRANLLVGSSLYAAAKSLGVTLVIVDRSGHWLQKDTDLNKRLREGFIEVHMEEDDGISARIVAGIRGYPHRIDGLLTLEDQLLVPVAKASTELSLPTSPVRAYEIASDKHASRAEVALKGEFVAIHSEEELTEAITSGEFLPRYPLIVKPRARAWASQYIFKATNEDDLTVAVNHVVKKYDAGAIIEPYYDGPEIDINLIMVDGDASFVDLADELPSNGDLSEDQKTKFTANKNDFLETAMITPSSLPLSEKEKAVTFMTDLVKRLGFRNAVLHTEARLTNSLAEYKETDGIVDLVEKDKLVTQRSGEFQCHLIEINSRPPGLPCLFLAKRVYGVDHYANVILIAVGETSERIRAACQTFSIPGFPAGAQCFAQSCMLPVLKGGFPRGATDPFTELLGSCNPDQIAHVAHSQCYFLAGQDLPVPSECLSVFMGEVVVVSTESRREVMDISENIRRKWYDLHGHMG